MILRGNTNESTICSYCYVELLIFQRHKYDKISDGGLNVVALSQVYCSMYLLVMGVMCRVKEDKLLKF